MLKNFSFLLLFLLISPVYVHSDSIDFPYYMGLVTTDGGTTINDGYWMQYHNSGYRHSFDGGYTGSFTDTGARAVRLLNNGAIAVLFGAYAGATWSLEDADIYRVNQNTLVYYGCYSFDDNEAWLIDNPQRVKRQLRTGETFNRTENIGADTQNTAITFERKGITLSANVVPGSSSVADCAFIHFYNYSDSEPPIEFDYTTSIMAPGKGELAIMGYEPHTGDLGVWSQDLVTAWGTSADYPAYMTAEFTAALATLNGLTLSDANIVDVRPTGGTKVVVIPMN